MGWLRHLAEKIRNTDIPDMSQKVNPLMGVWIMGIEEARHLHGGHAIRGAFDEDESIMDFDSRRPRRGTSPED